MGSISNLCILCKGGKLLCGRNYCPLNLIYRIKKPIEKKLKNELYTPSPPSVFVGSKGYPLIFTGPMNALNYENPEILDNPRAWYGCDFNRIIEFRTNLIRSKKPIHVKTNNRFVEELQTLVLSVKNLYVETKFKRKPKYGIKFSRFLQPLGPAGEIEKFTITDNPKIPKKVDAIVSDELKASEQVFELYRKGFDVYYITKLLSVGIFGMNKKLVPTRWSITATDDIIAKELLKKIRTYPEVTEYLVWENTYLDNHFEILFIPGSWGFEQFESWFPGTVWSKTTSEPTIVVENESFRGRGRYAEKEGGGYYASRLAVCEQLEKMKRQARVVIFREIYESYVIPVGVWEVRENVRHAFEKSPRKFSSLEEALQHIGKRLRISVTEYVKRSSILSQKNLFSFF